MQQYTPTPGNSTARRNTIVLGLLAMLFAIINPFYLNHAKAAGLLIADGGLGGVLEIQEQTVNVTINNGIAVTEIEQIFLNTESRQVEALYTFPVPKNASVANFSMWIGGKEMIGEVVEKQRARKIYNSYKKVRRDPGLLEQVDYKTFEMRIFPINAKAQQRIKVTYYQELDFDHDQVSYVYPLATVTQENINQTTTGKLALNIRVLSEVPIINMQSPSHVDGFAIANHSPNFYEASYENSAGSIAKDFVLNYDLSRPQTGIDVITSKPKNEDGYFMLTLTAGKELETLSEPMDYVFLLDVSGSMQNASKLTTSKNAIYAFIKALSPEDRFEVMSFNVQPNQLFKQLQQADQTHLKLAMDFLDDQQARGGTRLAPALQTAFSYNNPDRQLNIIILSDGMTEQAQRNTLINLVSQRPEGARLFSIGVGNEVNRPLLGQLAKQTDGLAAFISRGDDFQRQAKSFRRKLTRPAATHVQMQFTGAAVYDVEPAVLPALYHGAPIRVFGRYRKGSNVNVHVQAEVLGKQIKQEVPIDFPTTDAGNPQIERMWASHRIDSLLSSNSNNAIEQVVGLGEAYSIVTEYTSFLVLENDAEYKRWQIDRKNAIRIKRDRAARDATHDQLAKLRKQATQRFAMTPQTQAIDQTMMQQVQTKAVPQVQRQSQPVQQSQRRKRDLNFGFPSIGGGGAIDPLTASVVLALGFLALIRVFRKRSA